MILYLFNQWPKHLGLKGMNYNELYVCSSNSVLDLIQSLKAVIGIAFFQWAEKLSSEMLSGLYKFSQIVNDSARIHIQMS